MLSHRWLTWAMPHHSPGNNSPLLSPSHSPLTLCFCTECCSIFIQCQCWPTGYKEIWILPCPQPGREDPLGGGDLEMPWSQWHNPFVISSKTDWNRWRKKTQTLCSRAATTNLKLVTILPFIWKHSLSSIYRWNNLNFWMPRGDFWVLGDRNAACFNPAAQNI